MWSSLKNDVFDEKRQKNAIFLLKKYHRYSILLDTVRSSHSEHLNSHSTKFSTIDILRPGGDTQDGLFDPFSHFW